MLELNFVTPNEEAAKEISKIKQDDNAKNKLIAKDKTTLFDNIKNKDELNIIIKSDVQGSSEALKMAIDKINMMKLRQILSYQISE